MKWLKTSHITPL